MAKKKATKKAAKKATKKKATKKKHQFFECSKNKNPREIGGFFLPNYDLRETADLFKNSKGSQRPQQEQVRDYLTGQETRVRHITKLPHIPQTADSTEIPRKAR